MIKKYFIINNLKFVIKRNINRITIIADEKSKAILAEALICQNVEVTKSGLSMNIKKVYSN